jgi:mycofactocin system glycosyltransferase
MSTQPRLLAADRHWWRSKDRLGLVAGSPGTYFRVTEAGASALDDIEGARPVSQSTLVDRLIAAGAAHPRPGTPVPPDQVTVVIPTHCRTEAQVARLGSLVGMLAPVRVIVVDDASPVAPSPAGATLHRMPANSGPGAARNAGLALVTTPVVAFVDDDVTAAAADILALSGHLADPNVSFVAPRIVAEEGGSFLADYERLRSPLDMGASPARVRPGSVVPYVPSAVLVARTDSMRDGFDASMRTGEDVEFVWRSTDDAAQCRYEPSVECPHAVRRGWWGLLAQRFAYGRSAADIDRRMPWSVPPVRGHLLHLLPVVLLLAGQLIWALDAALVSAVFTVASLRRMKLGRRELLAIARLNVLLATRHVATAVTREWWPLFVAASFFSIGAQVAFFFCLAMFVMIDIVRLRPDNIGLYAVLRVLDPLAYGAGVWAGAVRRGSPRCLLPVVTLRARRRDG